MSQHFQNSMLGASYREMVRRDLPKVMSLSHDNMANIIFSSWGVELRDEDIMRFILRPTALNEVLEKDGEIIGYYSVDIRADNLLINSIQVQRDFQGQGLGTDMMKRIAELAYHNGMNSIDLWVQITNRPAIAFYRHRGYRAISRQGNNYLMRKVLDRGGEGVENPSLSAGSA